MHSNYSGTSINRISIIRDLVLIIWSFGVTLYL